MFDKSKIFRPEYYFDLKDLSFKEIFKNISYVWQIITHIQDFIESSFKIEKLIKNYDKNKLVSIGEGSVIQDGVSITGPAIIGKNCFIGHGSLIRENCLLGDNVHVGHATEIKNSILLDGAISAHLNYIGDSIIGRNVNISGGTIFANLRLDKNYVSIKLGNEKIDTGLLKFSSIIGDNCMIGVNSVLNPGTLIGRNSVVYPLTSVTGFYKEESVIK